MADSIQDKTEQIEKASATNQMVVRTSSLPFDTAMGPHLTTDDAGQPHADWPYTRLTYEIHDVRHRTADCTLVMPDKRVDLFAETHHAGTRGISPYFGFIYDASSPDTVLWSGWGMQDSIQIDMEKSFSQRLLEIAQTKNADGMPAWLFNEPHESVNISLDRNAIPPEQWTDTQINVGLQQYYWNLWLAQHPERSEPQHEDFPQLTEDQFTKLYAVFNRYNYDLPLTSYNLGGNIDLHTIIHRETYSYSSAFYGLVAVHMHHLMQEDPGAVMSGPLENIADRMQFKDFDQSLYHGSNAFIMRVPRARSKVEIGGLDHLRESNGGMNHIAIVPTHENLAGIFIRDPKKKSPSFETLKRQALLTQVAAFDDPQTSTTLPVMILSPNGHVTPWQPTQEEVLTILKDDSVQLRRYMLGRLEQMQAIAKPSPHEQVEVQTNLIQDTNITKQVTR